MQPCVMSSVQTKYPWSHVEKNYSYISSGQVTSKSDQQNEAVMEIFLYLCSWMFVVLCNL